MFPDLEVRAADSPLIERIWRSHSRGPGAFTSIAVVSWSMVISCHQGRVSISVHGPETRANRKHFPACLEWFGIEFKLGTYMPWLLPGSIMDRCETLPAAGKHTFWLAGSAWQLPDYENADTFVDRLVRQDLLACDPLASAMTQDVSRMSLRARQYRVQRSTGLSQRTIRQIKRARLAATLLKRGAPILDTVTEAGYSDQPHLTRSLKRFIGCTPAAIPTASIVALTDFE